VPIDLPAATDGVAAGPSGIGQQRCEPLYPPVDGDVVNLDAAVDQELLHVAVGQAKAQVPADRDDDHVGRKARVPQLIGVLGGSWG